MGLPLTVAADPPDATTRAAVVALANDVERDDGAPPLSDAALAALDDARARHVVVRSEDGVVVGYGQRTNDSAEVVATAAALDIALDAVLGDGDVLIWSHGQRSRVAPALRTRGLRPVRELYQLRRPLGPTAPLPPDPELPDGVRVRAFAPGADDRRWLAVNAAAFAGHPEQGGFTQADLDARMAEPWFDADGFLLADRAAELLGFHWTKVHPDGAGEVYVLGVTPASQGTGLGQALLVRGLHYLERRTCPYVLLYVDGDNASAVRLYERAGFTRHDVDVQWQALGA